MRTCWALLFVILQSAVSLAAEYTAKETKEFCDQYAFVVRECYIKFTPDNPRVPVTLHLTVETNKEGLVSTEHSDSLNSEKFGDCSSENVFGDEKLQVKYRKDSSLRCVFNFLPIDAKNLGTEVAGSRKPAATGIKDLMAEEVTPEDLRRRECRPKGLNVIEKVIDGYRAELGRCDKANDCVYSSGGKGVHVDKEHYYDLRECFIYADNRADGICRDGGKLNVEHQGIGGAGYAWVPGRPPESYTCVAHRCVGYWSVHERSKPYKLEYKWRAVVIPNKPGNLKKIAECKRKLEDGFLKAFGGNN